MSLSTMQQELLLSLLRAERTRIAKEMTAIMKRKGLQSGEAVRWQAHTLDLRDEVVLRTILDLEAEWKP